MAFSWSTTIKKGDYLTPVSFSEILELSQNIVQNHCASDYNSVNTSQYGYCGVHDSSVYSDYAAYGGCISYNSSVEDTKYSSKCVNRYDRTVNTTNRTSYTPSGCNKDRTTEPY